MRNTSVACILLAFLLGLFIFLSSKGPVIDEENFLDLIEMDDGKVLQDVETSLLRSREFIMKAVRVNGLSLQYAPDVFRDDREVCFAAVEENGNAIEFIGERFQNDKEIFLLAARQDKCYPNNFLFTQAGEELLEDKEFVLEVLKVDPTSLKMLPMNLRNDYDVVMQAVRTDGSVLRYVANDELLNDREIVNEAVQSDGCSLQYLKESFQQDKEVVLNALRRSPLSFEFAHEKLKEDKEVVIEFFRNLCDYYYEGTDMSSVFPNGLSEELRSDEDVALEIIFSILWRESFGRLYLISEDLFHDEEFLWRVLKYRDFSKDREFSILQIVPEEFRNRMDIVEAALEQDKETFPLQDTLSYASEEIRSSKEIILNKSSTSFSYQEFQDVSEELRGDKEVVLHFVEKRGVSLRFASEELRCDRDVVKVAVAAEGRAIEYACDELQREREIVLLAVKNHGFSDVKPEFRDDKEVVLTAVRHSGSELRIASERLKDDEEVVLTAVEEGGVYALTFASERMKLFRKVVFEAVKNWGHFSLNTQGIVIDSMFRNDEKFVLEVSQAIREIAESENRLEKFKERYDQRLSLPIGKKTTFYRRSLCSESLQCSSRSEYYFYLRDYELEEAFEITIWWERFRFLSQVGGRLRRSKKFLEKFLTSFGSARFPGGGLCDLIYDERFERRRNKLFVRVMGDRFFEIAMKQFGCSLDHKKESGKGEIGEFGGWFQIFSW